MVDIETPGLDTTIDKLKAMSKRGKNLRPAFKVIDKLLESHVSRTFETEGTHGGKKWPSLRPRTVAARTGRWGYYRRSGRGSGPSGPVLQWTQSLRKSFKMRGRYHIRQITAKTMRWGSEHPIADYHQKAKGKRRKYRRMMLQFASKFQKREITSRPIEMYLMGVPVGAIETVMKARTRS